MAWVLEWPLHLLFRLPLFAQSTRFCADNATKWPVLRKFCASSAPSTENAQHEPHIPCFSTLETCEYKTYNIMWWEILFLLHLQPLCFSNQLLLATKPLPSLPMHEAPCFVCRENQKFELKSLFITVFKQIIKIWIHTWNVVNVRAVLHSCEIRIPYAGYHYKHSSSLRKRQDPCHKVDCASKHHLCVLKKFPCDSSLRLDFDSFSKTLTARKNAILWDQF